MSREIKQGDRVSYRRRAFMVRTVWGGAMAGQIDIMPVSPFARESGLTLPAARLVWSDTRSIGTQPGCWIVVKP